MACWLAAGMLVVYMLSLTAANYSAPELTAVEAGNAGVRTVSELELDATEVYFLSLGSYEDAESARIEAARNTERGAAGYIMEKDGRFLNLGAMYSTQAELSAKRMATAEGLECQVVSSTAGGITLRITGTEEETAAVQNGYEALDRSLSALNEAAFELDDGNISIDQARTRIKAEAVELKAVLEELEAATGGRNQPVLTPLCSIAGEFVEALEDIYSKKYDSELLFSSEIKYNCIMIRINQIDYLGQLSDRAGA